MEFSKYLLLPDGRLRAGWRVLIFIGLYIFALMISSWAFYGLLSVDLFVYSAAVQLAATITATWLMLRFFDRRSFLSVGLSPSRGAVHDLGYGFLLGFAMVEVVIVVEVTTGMVAIEQISDMSALAFGSLTGVLGLLLVAASAEEVLFRGYPFQRLVEGIGGGGAIALTSVLFGWMHAGNPDATALSMINTVLAGILFSVAYLKTQALWLPIGAHFAWNWTLAVSGFPVSGLVVIEMPWRALSASGTVWLHGGGYGPEGGLVGTVVLGLGISIVATKLRPRAPEIEKTSGPAAGLDGSL